MSFGQQNPQAPDPQRPNSQDQDPQGVNSQPTETLYPNQPGAQEPGQGWGGPGPSMPGTSDPGQGWGAPRPSAPSQGWGAPHPSVPSQGWGAPGPSMPGQGWGTRPGPAGPSPAGPGAPAGRYKGALSRMSPAQKGLAAAGVAVIVAVGAGAAVYAATSAGNASAASSNQGLGAPGQAGGGQNGLGQGGTGRGFGAPGNLGLGGAAQALHGEYVVQNNGQYVTELEQTGTITGVSGSQVTVKSDDGYVQAYAISSDTTITSFAGRRQSQPGGGSLDASSLASGQTVHVTALKDGNAALTILVSSTAGTSSNGSGSGSSGSGTSGSGSTSSGQSN